MLLQYFFSFIVIYIFGFGFGFIFIFGFGFGFIFIFIFNLICNFSFGFSFSSSSSSSFSSTLIRYRTWYLVYIKHYPSQFQVVCPQTSVGASIKGFPKAWMQWQMGDRGGGKEGKTSGKRGVRMKNRPPAAYMGVFGGASMYVMTQV